MQINKEELSVYKYTNKLSRELLDELQKDFDYLLTCKNEMLNFYDSNKAIDDNQLLSIADKCINKYPKLVFTDGPGQNKMKSFIKINYDIRMNHKFSAKCKTLLLDQCLSYLQIMLFSDDLRGESSAYEEVSFLPKLLLISDKAYDDACNAIDLTKNVIDFSELERLMPKDIAFNVFIKGNSRASRLAFQTFVSKGGYISIFMWDRCFGCFSFKVIKNKNNEHTLVPTFNCLQKNDGSWCGKSLSCDEECCVKHFCDCKDKRIQMACIVLNCVQEYLIRKEEAKSLTKTSSNKIKTTQKSNTKSFRINGKITIHNYGTKQRHTGKFTGTGHSGIQKCPHVRSGYWRTYKNGKRVYVRGCIIHKDDYNGYASADEI